MRWLTVLVVSVTSSCSWLTDYGHCTCRVEAEGCKEIEVSTEQVRQADERELERP